MNPEDMNDKGAEYLARAIILYAVKDYRKALRDYRKSPYAITRVIAIERFFLSEYGQLLCYGRGAYIMEQVRREEGY